MIDSVLIDPHDHLAGVIGLHWYSSCSMYWLTVSREPAQEYGASACPRGPGCSVSQVSLSIEPTQD